jgi:adenylate kinase
MRRWFWTRKPDAGFVLTDFPATLLQAKVLDEWLDARDESLDAVLNATTADVAQTAKSASSADSHHVIQHYRDQGLAIIDSVDFIDFIDPAAASPAPLAA